MRMRYVQNHKRSHLAGILLVFILFSQNNLLQPSLMVLAQEQQPKATTFRKGESNLHTPELYANDLRIQLTLVDLPGAQNPDSSWEVTYQLYFISEAEFERVIFQPLQKKASVNGGSFASRSSNTDPSQFPEKILLAKRTVRKSLLSTLMDRTEIVEGIPFRSRVPDLARTKFAHLMTSYAVKIYDAQLKIPIYRSTMFMTYPFEDDPEHPGKTIARTTLFVNFFVTPEGKLFTSQTPRSGNDTRW